MRSAPLECEYYKANAEDEEYDTQPVERQKSCDVASASAIARLERYAPGFEVFSHEEEDEDVGESGDRDRDDEAVAP